MSALSILERYFSPAGTAEGDGNILDEAFVPLEDFVTIINPPYASPRLLVGRKGSGKTAFVRFFKNRMGEVGVPVLLLRPEDMDLTIFSKSDSTGQMIRVAKEVILLSIARALSSNLGSFLVDGDKQVLSAFSTNQGTLEKDWVQKLHAILVNVAKEFTKADFKSITDHLHGVTPDSVKSAVFSNLGKERKVIYILIDDTDQVAAPDDKSHLNRIWAFILAARSILQDSSFIRIIVNIRLEVWIRLQRDSAGQRDQVDHVRGFVYLLNSTEEHVKKVVNRRLELANKDLMADTERNGLTHYAGGFSNFCEAQGLNLPKSKHFTSWLDLIVKRSRERPRDAIQFVAHLIAEAKKKHNLKINAGDALAALKVYSQERADDLKREGENECSAIKEVIRSFSKLDFDRGSFKASADSVKKHLGNLPGAFSIQLFGETLHQGNDEHVFKLWRYLWDLGFFGARCADDQASRGFNHSATRDNLDLIDKRRWSSIQAYTWEINPAYRDFLISEGHGF
jgi:hypothetical protein